MIPHRKYIVHKALASPYGVRLWFNSNKKPLFIPNSILEFLNEGSDDALYSERHITFNKCQFLISYDETEEY